MVHRRLHFWVALLVALPFFLTLVTGSLLLLRGEVPWIQPPAVTGEWRNRDLALGEILLRYEEAITREAGSVPSGMNWQDIRRLVIQPDRGVIQVEGKDGEQVQLNVADLRILGVGQRRTTWLIRIHEFSFLPHGRLWVGVPAAIGLWILFISGLFMIGQHYQRGGISRWRRERTLDLA